MSKNSMSKAAGRIRSATAKSNGGVAPKGAFAAKTQAAASKATSTPPPNGPSKTGNSSGGGRGNNPPSK